MIEYIEGDIFESPAQVIVNTVNTVGVMGKGLALSFKQRYPQMFEKYKMACEKHQQIREVVKKQKEIFRDVIQRGSHKVLQHFQGE